MRYGADVNENDKPPFAHIWTLHYGNAEKLIYHTACGLPLWLYLAVSMAQLVSFKILRATPTWVPSQAKVLSPAHNGSTFSLKSIS